MLPIGAILGIAGMFKSKKIEGVSSGVVDKVVDAFQDYVTKDEKAQVFLAEQIELSRQHDIKLMEHNSRFVNDLRGAVRPVVSFIAIGWYVYARVNDIALTHEDYAIIGGVLAFWFGFRPFEKRSGK